MIRIIRPFHISTDTSFNGIESEIVNKEINYFPSWKWFITINRMSPTLPSSGRTYTIPPRIRELRIFKLTIQDIIINKSFSPALSQLQINFLQLDRIHLLPESVEDLRALNEKINIRIGEIKSKELLFRDIFDNCSQRNLIISTFSLRAREFLPSLKMREINFEENDFRFSLFQGSKTFNALQYLSSLEIVRFATNFGTGLPFRKMKNHSKGVPVRVLLNKGHRLSREVLFGVPLSVDCDLIINIGFPVDEHKALSWNFHDHTAEICAVWQNKYLKNILVKNTGFVQPKKSLI